MKRLLVLAWMGLATPGLADNTQAARTAALELAEAGAMLAAAEDASDRIAALTETVRAYEAGLSLLREGLVSVTLAARDIEGDLAGRDAELAEFLVVLQTVSRRGPTQALIHPGSARDTIHAGLLASSFVPDLQARAAALETRLTELSDLKALREAGIATLDDGVRGAREARLQLAEALTNRTDLPPRQALDEATTLALLNSTETLTAFADLLVTETAQSANLAPKSWSPPVDGEISQGFNTASASGIARPGLTFLAPSEALVTAPAPANIRFSGDIPDQGRVVILEPKAGHLIILAGLDQSFVRQGQIVAKGEPIGLMGGKLADAQENLNELLRNGSLLGQETLYMEVRQGQSPIDPASLLMLGDT